MERMHKFVVAGASDEFFMSDSSKHFYPALRGPKHYWQVYILNIKQPFFPNNKST